MSKRKDDPAPRPDDENPEWTREDFRNARPALEVGRRPCGIRRGDAAAAPRQHCPDEGSARVGDRALDSPLVGYTPEAIRQVDILRTHYEDEAADIPRRI